VGAICGSFPRRTHLLVPNRHFVLSLDGSKPYAPISPNGRYMVYNYSRIDLPTRLVIRRVADASLVAEVDHCDDSALRAAGWRPPESFTVKAADGVTDLWGTIYRPSDFDPAKQYPIIDAQYASPLTAVVPHNFYTAFRGLQPLAPSSYAELGFIVISVDARGTTYRSADFSQAAFAGSSVYWRCVCHASGLGFYGAQFARARAAGGVSDLDGSSVGTARGFHNSHG
jgi:dipeptidyl-peptidase-4